MWSHLVLWALLCVGVPIQETPSEPAETPAPVTGSLGTLSALERAREAKLRAIQELKDPKLLDPAAEEDPAERDQRLAAKRTLQAELEQINYDYESVATGIDVKAFDLVPTDEFDLQDELLRLVQPIVEELKSATEAPRQIERLRSQLSNAEERERRAREALKSVESLLAELPPEDTLKLRTGLEGSRDTWRTRIDEISGQRTIARFQLEKRVSQRTSIIDSTQNALANFFRTRGLNLILALGTFLLVLIVMRAVYRRVVQLTRRKPREGRAFYARLIDVLYFVFVGLIALTAALLVLYAADDWVLLGLTLLFLLGIAWAGKTAIPMFLEQIRLLLDLGTVRERERVVMDGVPYRVSKLSFYTLLSNPDLAGGVRRLPLRDLIDMRSRTCSKDEIWFPCKRGDWVLLSDGKRGEVKHQSPDSVQIQPLGGSRVTYATSDFVGLAPQNLSAGFRLAVRFGIDYEHQAISTTEVPEVFAKDVRAGLESQFGAEILLNLKVEFIEAGASSLDYVVIIDVTGQAAPHYDALQRAIQRVCVETCNREGWVIPFTQITLHQASSG